MISSPADESFKPHLDKMLPMTTIRQLACFLSTKWGPLMRRLVSYHYSFTPSSRFSSESKQIQFGTSLATGFISRDFDSPFNSHGLLFEAVRL